MVELGAVVQKPTPMCQAVPGSGARPAGGVLSKVGAKPKRLAPCRVRRIALRAFALLATCYLLLATRVSCRISADSAVTAQSPIGRFVAVSRGTFSEGP